MYALSLVNPDSTVRTDADRGEEPYKQYELTGRLFRP